MPQVVTLRLSYLFMINYSYIVIDSASNEAVIVDPAWQIEKIDQALKNAEASISGILLTHSHLDHVHLAKPLSAKYDCPIWMSHEEIAASGFRAERLVGIDRRPWLIGKMLIRPIFTPGHTPGSICYLIEDNLFSGDTLFAEGCGLCSNTHAAHTMFTSLEHLKSQLKPQTHIFPGHSYGKPPGRKFSLLLKENIYLQFDNKDQFARYRLRNNQNKLKLLNFS